MGNSNLNQTISARSLLLPHLKFNLIQFWLSRTSDVINGYILAEYQIFNLLLNCLSKHGKLTQLVNKLKIVALKFLIIHPLFKCTVKFTLVFKQGEI